MSRETGAWNEQPLTVIGAGLAGCLVAVLLARRGRKVELFERHSDQRSSEVPAGRSINLALAERGRAALSHAGLLGKVEAFALPMTGRMIHDEAGATRLQPYGRRADELIWSVHRGRLNRCLLDAAEDAGVAVRFDRALERADFRARTLIFADRRGRKHATGFRVAIGCDGAGSTLRREMGRVADLGVREEPLGHGYKELTIPPAPGGGFRMEPGALHIWPRGGYMMIALPNPDGSFTCTLFLENDDEPGFEQLADPADARDFMEANFPDAVALMPDLDAELAANPVGFLGTLYADRWHLGGKAVLVGDAAHAIVPFHGQGMNAAFEDTVALAGLLDSEPDFEAAFEAFESERKPNADAIAAMALDNYLEMRDRVRDPRFHLRKQLEFALEERLPDWFIPRYSMVMFRPEISYAEALRRGEIQAGVLEEFTEGVDELAQVDLDRAVDRARTRLAEAGIRP